MTADRLAALLHQKWTCRNGHDRVPYPCDTLAGILAAAGVTVAALAAALAVALAVAARPRTPKSGSADGPRA